MRNMFIVNFESRDGISAKALAELFTREYCSSPFRTVRFNVEDGGREKIFSFISAYLDAEDALSKYESKHGIVGKCELNSPIGQEWKRLYDNVHTNRAILVSKCREYGYAM